MPQSLVDFIPDCWDYNTLEVETNYVAGTASREIDGYLVVAHITSYEITDGYNHVPIVTVEDIEDRYRIVDEPHVRDSTDPHQAIQNATNTATAVIEDIKHSTGTYA